MIVCDRPKGGRKASKSPAVFRCEGSLCVRLKFLGILGGVLTKGVDSATSLLDWWRYPVPGVHAAGH